MIYVRVYIAIILLLLLLTVSQVCATGAWRLSKEPTYKIWASNSINKATKVTISGSGPGCPYGLDSKMEWSKIIALKRLFLVLQNLHKHSISENSCQLFHFMIPADCGNDFPNALLCCNEGKANIFLVKTKYFSNIFIEIYDRIWYSMC